MFRTFSFLILITIFFTNSVMASSQEGLKTLFDEYNYSLNVEWDQHDQNFLYKKNEELSNGISDLISAGMTYEDIIVFVKSQLHNDKQIQELDYVLNAVEIGKMTSSEAVDFFNRAMKDSQRSGANWNASPINTVFIALLVMVFGFGLYLVSQTDEV